MEHATQNECLLKYLHKIHILFAPLKLILQRRSAGRGEL